MYIILINYFFNFYLVAKKFDENFEQEFRKKVIQTKDLKSKFKNVEYLYKEPKLRIDILNGIEEKTMEIQQKEDKEINEDNSFNYRIKKNSNSKKDKINKNLVNEILFRKCVKLLNDREEDKKNVEIDSEKMGHKTISNFKVLADLFYSQNNIIGLIIFKLSL